MSWFVQVDVSLFIVLLLTTLVYAQIRDARCMSNFGNFAHPTVCSQYVSCWGGRGFTQRCGPGLVFNADTRQCVRGVGCQGGVRAPDPGVRVRLDAGSGSGVWAGRVEVWLAQEGKWAGLRADQWNSRLSHSTCVELGFPGAESSWSSSVRGGGGDGGVVSLECMSNGGDTISLTHCSFTPCPSCSPLTPLVSLRCRRPSLHRCPEGGRGRWERWGDHCYLVESRPASQASAAASCLSQGASLAYLHSKAEHNYLSQLLSRVLSQQEYLTGGTRRDSLGQWTWDANGRVGYSLWWPGWNNTRPRAQGNCLVLKKFFPLDPTAANPLEVDAGYFYFDGADCGVNRPFMCKAPLSDVGCYSENGSTYSGPADVTITKRHCLPWSHSTINSLGRSSFSSSFKQLGSIPTWLRMRSLGAFEWPHPRIESLARNFDLGLIGNHNKCRNPNGSASPWCYVEPGVTETCTIPRCRESSERMASLLRPLSSPSTTTTRPTTTTRTTTTSTTTTSPTTSIAKVRCSTEQHKCAFSDSCLTSRQVCDGNRDCPRGDDEQGCKQFVQGFTPHTGQTLLAPIIIRRVNRADVGVCAKLCSDKLSCRGFIHYQASKRCELTNNEVSTNGLTSSSSSLFYESTSRRHSCALDSLKCRNGKCISPSLVCDGIDDCLDGTDEGDCQKGRKGGVRLVGGRGKENEGNVQIEVEGEWRNVCDDKFGFNEADVLCRSLGYTSAVAYTRNNKYGQNNAEERRASPNFWLDKVACTGQETHILSCTSSGLGVHDCGPTEIAGVECRTPVSVCNEGEFRCGRPRSHTCITRVQVCDGVNDCGDGSDEADKLCDDVGVTKLEDPRNLLKGAVGGNVYLKHGGRWGTVCDDGFNDVHAKVVCRSVGYEGGWAVSYPRAFFGQGNGDVLLDEPGCRGGEAWLGACPRVIWGVSDCDHSEDVGVLCSDQIEVQLVGGPTVNSGRVEVKLSGVWGSVCDDDFDDYDAKVVCGMLGYNGDAIFHRGSKFGRSTGPIWLDSLDCTGLEKDLMACHRSQPAASDCTHAEDVGVTCYTVKRNVVSRELKTVLGGSCGRAESTTLLGNLAKIVGGSVQPRYEHPWLVSLQLREEGRLKHNCGGVLIAEDLVLSAAHCFKVHGKDSYVVRVGDYSMSSFESAQQDFLIEKLHVHPEFDTTVEFNNDLAILKIARRNGRGVRLGKSIQPGCLPMEDASYNNLQDCTIIGWGTTSERAPPVPQDLPRSARVNVFKTRECLGPGRYDDHQVTSGMVCAGDMTGKVDTCTGDSGGPLMCTHGGKRTLYGITSWGKGCGRKNQPGMYTKITKFLRWILEVVR